MNTEDAEAALRQEVAKYYDDPLGFVRLAYPWGQPGPLELETGPDDNQAEFLTTLGAEVKRRAFDGSTPVMPILMSEASGHGSGKSVLGAWLAAWLLSTRPGSIGTVTAGTYTQLSMRTWAAIKHWTGLCITAHWFDIQDSGVFSKQSPDVWKVIPQTCRKENAQAFAGQHARTSTSWYLFDEASEVPETIWETAYGGLTDGEPMMFVWGQLVRNSGAFYEVCYGKQGNRWNHRRVDSRSSRFANKELIQQWIEDYGEDSDFVRVRVLGTFPKASELQFIDWERVRQAQERAVTPLSDEPLILGVDVSGGGEAWTVGRYRRGPDARSIPPFRLTGEKSRDRGVIVGVIAEALRDPRRERRPDVVFVDTAFGAPVVERLHALRFENVHEVAFGSESPDHHQANLRAYMYNRTKDWLLYGGIPKDDEGLAVQLTRPGYHINRSSKLVIESKADMAKRGEASPDDADALALTFARPVAPVKKKQAVTPPGYRGSYQGGAWS